MNLTTVPVDAAVLGILLGSLLVAQAALTLWFVARVRAGICDFRGRAASRAAAAEVPAEVVLCLRGRDPTLDHVLAALAGQSHRRWRLQVVVDSEADPAWDATRRALDRLAEAGTPSWGDVVVVPLAARGPRGSLKCASLRQALTSLAAETRVIAFVDADAVVHRDWLSTLVDECTRPAVGAVSGNRWYEPGADSVAGVVRVVWNAGAVAQMTAFGIPWGGSLAVRREAMENCGWLDVMESSLCEDTALAAPLAAAGWRYRYVPALTAVDEDDDVSLGPLTRWITRQLLTARLHHPLWPLVAAHGLGTSAALAAALAGLVAAAATARYTSLALIAGGLLAFQAGTFLMLLAIAAASRFAVAARDARIRPLTIARVCRWAAMLSLAQAVYAAATIRAIGARSVEWRGVVYAITRVGGRAGVVIADQAAGAKRFSPARPRLDVACRDLEEVPAISALPRP